MSGFVDIGDESPNSGRQKINNAMALLRDTGLFIFDAGAPTDEVGENGQYHVDTNTGAIRKKEDGTWTASLAAFLAAIADGSITQAKIAEGLFIPEILAELPVLPDAAYPLGALVILTTDGKIYRNIEGSWTSGLAVSDLTGAITEAQIAAGAITLTKFASGIAVPQVIDELPTLPDADYPENTLVVLSTDGKLYRNTADVWTAEVEAGDITGQLTADQIAANAITAAKIAAGAVGTDQLAANAVTAGKILAGSIISGKVAAGAIDTAELAANAVTAAKILAGAVTAEKVTVDGTVTISDSAQSSGALSVKDDSDAEVVRLGNINGKAGVPSGTQFGLWGAMGTGVFIQGAPRMIVAGSYLHEFTTDAIISGQDDVLVMTNVAITPPTLTIPDGKLWIPIIGINHRWLEAEGYDELLSVEIGHSGGPAMGSSGYNWSGANVFTAGTYTEFWLDISWRFHATAAHAGGQDAELGVSFVILEVDDPS